MGGAGLRGRAGRLPTLPRDLPRILDALPGPAAALMPSPVDSALLGPPRLGGWRDLSPAAVAPLGPWAAGHLDDLVALEEPLVTRHPLTRDVDPVQVDALLAVQSGFLIRTAASVGPDADPRFVDMVRALAHEALDWLRHRRSRSRSVAGGWRVSRDPR